MMRALKYERRGLLAIDPKAFFELFCFGDAARENVEMGEAVIVDVRGPLEQHAHSFWDSYEDIVARVAAACSTAARAIVMRFDSPGGDAAGCFEAANEIRALCDAAGKQWFSFADGDCCSAAYALACKADSITISNTALIGSIGVLSSRDDYSAQNAARGVRVALIASGARKADGHPDQPLSDAEIANTQAIVDSMASVFYELVASGRGLDVERIAQLEAKVFHGASAVGAGLADQVGSLKTVLATVASGSNGETAMAEKEKSPYETARAALEEAAKGDDANAEAAKRALAAMDPPKDPGDDEKKEGAEGEPAKEPAPEPDGDEKKAATAAAAWREAIAARRETQALKAQLAKRDEQSERAAMLDRDDLAPDMVALLKKAPIELVRETIKDLGPATKTAAASKLGIAAVRQPVTGLGQDNADAGHLPPHEKSSLDARMGLTTETSGTRNTDHKLILGVRVPRVETPATAAKT